MRVLITGNLGYIGSVLSNEMKDQYEITGYDIGYFKDCILQKQNNTFKQINKDIYDINEADLENIDAIVHLAALSNDPLGEFDKQNTHQTNYLATMKLANFAKDKKLEFSKSFYGPGFIMEPINWKNAVDIDDYEDLELAELIFNSLKSKNEN